MVQQTMTLLAKADNLRSVNTTHMVDGRRELT